MTCATDNFTHPTVASHYDDHHGINSVTHPTCPTTSETRTSANPSASTTTWLNSTPTLQHQGCSSRLSHLLSIQSMSTSTTPGTTSQLLDLPPAALDLVVGHVRGGAARRDLRLVCQALRTAVDQQVCDRGYAQPALLTVPLDQLTPSEGLVVITITFTPDCPTCLVQVTTLLLYGQDDGVDPLRFPHLENIQVGRERGGGCISCVCRRECFTSACLPAWPQVVLSQPCTSELELWHLLSAIPKLKHLRVGIREGSGGNSLQPAYHWGH
jgi:hypothetical protein